VKDRRTDDRLGISGFTAALIRFHVIAIPSLVRYSNNNV
jgi:hypothetical protein